MTLWTRCGRRRGATLVNHAVRRGSYWTCGALSHRLQPVGVDWRKPGFCWDNPRTGVSLWGLGTACPQILVDAEWTPKRPR